MTSVCFRSCSNSGAIADMAARTLRAKSGCEQLQQAAPSFDHLVGQQLQRDWTADYDIQLVAKAIARWETRLENAEPATRRRFRALSDTGQSRSTLALTRPRLSAIMDLARKALPSAAELASRNAAGNRHVGSSGEPQWHSRINEKVQYDIKESASIRLPCCARNCTVETIRDPICDQQGQCDVKSSERGSESRHES